MPGHRRAIPAAPLLGIPRRSAACPKGLAYDWPCRLAAARSAPAGKAAVGSWPEKRRGTHSLRHARVAGGAAHRARARMSRPCLWSGHSLGGVRCTTRATLRKARLQAPGDRVDRAGKRAIGAMAARPTRPTYAA
eukprot:scaffold241153_cov28-Tisochrysis_lutea.AAC.3